MSNKKTKTVQVLKNQDNSNELFHQWNEKKESNIICAETSCSTDVKDNAYIVTSISNQNENFLVPLCKRCYESESTTTSQDISDLIHLGSVIVVEENLLVKYDI